MSNEVDTRPWGSYEVLLDSKDCKVKRIVVQPNQRLSYQYHHYREEFWTVVKGQAVVTLDGKEMTLNQRQQVHIPFKAKHRIANKIEEPLIFIEIQMGTYFGEDDIIRIEDDYNRLENE